MISMAILASIESQCQVVKGSNSPFGGLKVVLITGDFLPIPTGYRQSPVGGRSCAVSR